MVAKNIQENQLLARVLEVLSLLVKYGYYDDAADVDEALRPLVSVINGFSDEPFVPKEKTIDPKSCKSDGGREGGGREGVSEGGRK